MFLRLIRSRETQPTPDQRRACLSQRLFADEFDQNPIGFWKSLINVDDVLGKAPKEVLWRELMPCGYVVTRKTSEGFDIGDLGAA